MIVQRAVFLIGSAMVAACFIAALITGDGRRSVIYGGACAWWAFVWVWGERYNR